MPFNNILFQAEISRYEDSEFEEYEIKNCNENRIDKRKVIDEMRKIIYERGECQPRRMDDAYLLRFLRSRRFIPALAHRLLVRYEEFRIQNSHLYRGIDAFGLKKVKHVYGAAFPESPECGRITLMRFGQWDPEAVSIDDVVRCAALMDEIAVMQPKIQILGITIIVDLKDLSLKHVKHLTPSIASQIVSLMGISFPVLTHGLHFVKYSWMLGTFFQIFKQFIPQYAWERLHFHGNDMNSLHRFINPKYLPPEYGGTSRNVIKTEDWIEQIDKYKDDYVIKELRELGFIVNDDNTNKSYGSYFD